MINNLRIALIAIAIVAISGCGGGGGVSTATITAKLADKLTGKPLIGRTVTVEGTSLSATTDNMGSFTIADVPVGHRVLLITDGAGNTVGNTLVTVTNVSPANELGTLSVDTSSIPPPPPLVKTADKLTRGVYPTKSYQISDSVVDLFANVDSIRAI